MKLYQLGDNKDTRTILSQVPHYKAYEKEGFTCLGECDKNGKLIKATDEVKDDTKDEGKAE